MNDHIVRATAQGVRAVAAVTTDLTGEAQRRHEASPVAAAALGCTMTAALLLAASLKNAESIMVKLNGDGPLGAVVADAHANGTVRGYVNNPQADLPLRDGKPDVGGGVGSGLLCVTRFAGLKHPSTGSTPLCGSEIAEDITHYLTVSEQIPSRIALDVLVNPDGSATAAGGILLQTLPGSAPDDIKRMKANLTGLPPVSSLIYDGRDAEGILKLLFHGLSLRLYEQAPLTFACACSRERVENMLISLGEQELQAMLKEGQAEVACHFCAEKYHFTEMELMNLLDGIAANRAK